MISNHLAIRDKVKSSHSIYISVRTNVTKDTLSTMDKYLDKLAELFANDCKFGFYFRPVGNWKMDEHFSLSSSLLVGWICTGRQQAATRVVMVAVWIGKHTMQEQ